MRTKHTTTLFRRLGAWALTLALVVGLLPQTAFAAGTDTGKAIQIGASGISGYDSTNGYDYIYYGTWNNSPIKWRVLDTKTNMANATEGDGLFLLSDVLLGTGADGGVYFDNTEPYSKAWQGSDAQDWCETFYSKSLTTQEQGAVLATTKSDEAYNSYSSQFASSENILNGDKVFFLSAEEAENSAYGFGSDNERKANYDNSAGCWWLRSPGANGTGDAGFVSYSGHVHYIPVNYDWAARPAFNLDLNSVLFTSAAVGGKSPAAGSGGTQGGEAADAIFEISNYSGNEWKLTLLDEAHKNFEISNATINSSGDTIAFSYSGAQTGTNEYISVVIEDSGAITHYGRILQPGSASGTASFTLPAGVTLSDTTKLYVFNEQYNGDKMTDYASPLREIGSPTVDTTAPTLSNGSATRTGETTATVKFTSDEAGSYYYVVDNNATAPNSIDTTTTAGTSCKANEETEISLNSLSGEYIHIVVKDAVGNMSQPLTVQIPAYTFTYAISASPETLDFGSEAEGYAAAPAAQIVTIKNTGNQSVTVNLPTSTNYIITAGEGFTNDTATLAPNGTAAFTVQPNTGLDVGSHDDTLNISGSDGTSASVELSFTVAFATGSDKAIMRGAEHLQGGQADNIYFGNYAQTDSTGNTKEPVKWRVLDNQTNFDSNSDGTNDAGLFLLSDVLLGTGTYGGVYFDNSGSDSNVWQKSTAQTWCKNFYSNNFSSKEQNAVLETTKSDTEFTSSTYRVPFAASENILNGDKVFFLSAEEAENSAYGFTDDNARIANYGNRAGYWWLRSPSADDASAAGLVRNYGIVDFRNVTYDWAARPAFNLDLNSVLFISAAEGGKISAAASGGNQGAVGADAIFEINDTDTNEWKLTLLDEAHKNFEISNATINGSGDTIAFSYSGAQTGTNEYISVVIENNGGITHYGRILQLDGTTNGASGTASLTLPAGVTLDNDTKLYVFNEQYNGDKMTDYASQLKEISSPTLDTTAPTLSNGSATRTGETTATVKFTSDEAGSYYYVVDNNATAPNSIDTTTAGASCKANEETEISIDSLSNGVQYIHIVVKDAVGNVSQPLTIQIPAYTFTVTVTVGSSGDGEASASPTTAAEGTEVTLSATPSEGYHFKEWQVTEGTVSIGADNKFTMPAENVAVKAIFEAHIWGNWTAHGDDTHTGTCSCGAQTTENCAYGNDGKCTVCGYVDVAITTQPQSASVKVGETATFTVAAAGGGLSTGEITYFYQWQSSTNGSDWEDIGGANDASYTISATTLGMSGNQYRCVVSNGKGDSAESNPATLTVRGTQAAPAAPTVSTTTPPTDTSITLEPISGGVNGVEYGYVKGTDGGTPTNWQDSTTFDSGLTAATPYTFYARYKGNSSYDQSPPSTGTTVYTAYAAPGKGVGYTINYTSEQVTAQSGYEVRVNSTDGWTASDTPLTITPGDSFQVRRAAATGGPPASAPTDVAVKARPAAPDLSIDTGDEGVTLSGGYYYNFTSKEVSATNTWTQGDGSVVTIQANTSIYIYAAATSTDFRSEVQTLTAPGQAAAPEVPGINYGTESLTGTSTDMEWGVAPSGQSVPSTWNDCSNGVTLASLGWTGSEMKVYFRTKANGSYASDHVTLTIPTRPGAPDLSIDNATESVTIPEGYRYNTASDDYAADGWKDGDGSPVTVAPGSAIYIYKAAVTSGSEPAFKSTVQTLTAPTRAGVPSVSINYSAETVSTTTALEYRVGTTGDWTACTEAMNVTDFGWDGSAEVTAYFRAAATDALYASVPTEALTIPKRPDAPSLQIDNEAESVTIPTDHRYNTTSSDYGDEGWQSGDGTPVTVAAGDTIYIYEAAKENAFKSYVQTLRAPGQAAAPEVPGINYGTESLTGTSANLEYTLADPSGQSVPSWTTCSDGMTLADLNWTGSEMEVYFRAKANGSYASDHVTLTIPARPGAPDLSIDNATESVSIPEGYRYNTSSGDYDAAGWKDGGGSPVTVAPGSAIYIYKAAVTSGSEPAFKSAVQPLAAPARAEKPSVSINYTAETVSTTTSLEYRVGTTGDWTACTEAMNVTAFGWDGSADVTVYFRTAATDALYASDPTDGLTIKARPAAPTGVSGGTNRIYGLTAAMEYLPPASGEEPAVWQPVPADKLQNGALSGLSAGMYQVRYAATDSDFASQPTDAFRVYNPSAPSRPSTTEPATGESGGWEEIGTEIADAQPGETIVVDMNGTTEVPAEIFEKVAGKDVTVEFDLGGGISWTVNGQDVPTGASFQSLNLGVDMGTSGISVNVINNITGEYGSVQVTLAHDGEFGFALTLTAPLGSDNAGHWANLYYYHEDSETLTFQTSGRIGADGSVSLRFTHASQYAIVIDDYSHEMPFEDVGEGVWYYDAVSYVYAKGLMGGTSATTFEPNTTTSRAMIAVILWRLEGSPIVEEYTDFSDVADGAWYTEGIRWASSVGVVGGYPNGSFGPDDPITREQMAAMLYRYADYKGWDVTELADLSAFTDAESISGYAVTALRWANAAGIVGGYNDSTLRPQGNARRSEAAAMLQRFCEAYIDSEE